MKGGTNEAVSGGKSKRSRRILEADRSSWEGFLPEWKWYVDIPTWMIESLDREAKRLGVPRQSLMKLWIAERSEALRQRTA